MVKLFQPLKILLLLSSKEKICLKTKLFGRRVIVALKCHMRNTLVLPSYRNQSINLLCNLIDWFLYEGNTGILIAVFQKVYSCYMLAAHKKGTHQVNDCKTLVKMFSFNFNNLVNRRKAYLLVFQITITEVRLV